MPLYDFSCGKCGALTERFMQMSVYSDTLPCEDDSCGGIATRLYSLAGQYVYSGLTDATVCYRNPDGSIGVLAHKDARIPEGSERIEMRSAAEVRKIEREMTAQEYRKFCDKQEREEHTFGAHAAEQRAELRRRMQGMSERGRAFARVAMAQNDQKSAPKFRTNVFFEAFSMDASNRQEHRSENTDWKPRK